MKNILLGGFLTVAGALLPGLILVGSAISATAIQSWSGNRWMYAIFQATPLSFGSIIIGGLFVLGLLMLLIGAVLLFKEWYSEWVRVVDSKGISSNVRKELK